MKPIVTITNSQDEISLFRSYQAVLRRAVEKTLERLSFSGRAAVDITLVSAREIRRLNRTTRGVDRVTDVLSFPLFEKGETIAPLPGEKAAFLGDVVICPKKIASQSVRFHTTFRQELCLMAIHSVLHLLGWDHMEENEKDAMFTLQEEIFASLGEGRISTEGRQNSESGVFKQ